MQDKTKTLENSSGGLSSIKEVLAYLRGRGYQISQSGLYKHKDEGKFKKDKKSGAYLIKAIDKYAKDNVPLEETGKKASIESDGLHIKKLKIDIKAKETVERKAQKELDILDGKYVEKDDMLRELVGRALVIDSEAKHMIKTTIPEIVELVGGDLSLVPQAIEVQLAKLDAMMNSFASTTDFVVDLELEPDN